MAVRVQFSSRAPKNKGFRSIWSSRPFFNDTFMKDVVGNAYGSVLYHDLNWQPFSSNCKLCLKLCLFGIPDKRPAFVLQAEDLNR